MCCCRVLSCRFIPITPNGTDEILTATTFSACLAECTAARNCQYVTYDYMTQICYVRYQVTQVYVG